MPQYTPAQQPVLPNFLQSQIWFQPTALPQIQPVPQQSFVSPQDIPQFAPAVALDLPEQKSIIEPSITAAPQIKQNLSPEFWFNDYNIWTWLIPSQEDLKRQATESIVQEQIEAPQKIAWDLAAERVLLNQPENAPKSTIKWDAIKELTESVQNKVYWSKEAPLSNYIQENKDYLTDYYERKIWLKPDPITWVIWESVDFLKNVLPVASDVAQAISMVRSGKLNPSWPILSRKAIEQTLESAPVIAKTAKDVISKTILYTTAEWLEVVKKSTTVLDKAKSLLSYLSNKGSDILDKIPDVARKIYFEWDILKTYKAWESLWKWFSVVWKWIWQWIDYWLTLWRRLSKVWPMEFAWNLLWKTIDKYSVTRFWKELVKDLPQYLFSIWWLNTSSQWLLDNIKAWEDIGLSKEFNKKYGTNFKQNDWISFKSQLNNFDKEFEDATTQQWVIDVAKKAKLYLWEAGINIENYDDYRFIRDETLNTTNTKEWVWILWQIVKWLDDIYLRKNKFQRTTQDLFWAPVVVKSSVENINKSVVPTWASASTSSNISTTPFTWISPFFNFKTSDIELKEWDTKIISNVDKTYNQIKDSWVLNYISEKDPELLKSIESNGLQTSNWRFAPYQLKANLANSISQFSKKIRDIDAQAETFDKNDPQVIEYKEKRPKIVKAYMDSTIEYIKSWFSEEQAKKANDSFWNTDKSETYSVFWAIPFDQVFNKKSVSKWSSLVWWALRDFWYWFSNVIASQINEPILNFVNLDNSSTRSLISEDATRMFPDFATAAIAEKITWPLLKKVLPKWKTIQTIWWWVAWWAWEVWFDVFFTEPISWVSTPILWTAISALVWWWLWAKDLYSKERAKWIKSYSDLSSDENLEWTHRQLYTSYNKDLWEDNTINIQKNYLKNSIDTLVQMDKSDPASAKQQLIVDKKAQIVVESAKLVQNDIAQSFVSQISNWVFDPEWAITQRDFNNAMQAKVSWWPIPKLQYNQNFLQKSIANANNFRDWQIQQLTRAEKVASNNNSTPSDVLAAISPKTYQNGVEIKPTINREEKFTERKTIIEMLPNEIDWIKIDWNNANSAQIIQWIMQSTDIWPQTKRKYINIFADIWNVFSTKIWKWVWKSLEYIDNSILWRWLRYVSNKDNRLNKILRKVTGTDLDLSTIFDIWVSDIYTQWKINDNGRKLLNWVMLTWKEFDNFITAQVEETNDLWSQRLYAYNEETKWFPPKVKWVVLPKDVNWNIERKIKLDKKPNWDPFHHKWTHILYVTWDLGLDSLIMQLNNSLNRYQWWYTEDGNLKPNAKNTIKNFIVSPWEYAHPQEYIDLIQQLYPDRDWKDLLYSVHTDEKGNLILSDTNTKVFWKDLIDWFWIFDISWDYDRDLYLNSIYNTAKFTDIYKKSREKYSDFLKSYMKEYKINNQKDDKYIADIPTSQLNRPDPIALTLQDTLIGNLSKIPGVNLWLLKKIKDWRIFETIVRINKPLVWDRSEMYRKSIEFLTDIAVKNRNDLVDMLSAEYLSGSEQVNDVIYDIIIANQEPDTYSKARSKTINNYSMILWYKVSPEKAGKIKWQVEIIKERTKQFNERYKLWKWDIDHTEQSIDSILNSDKDTKQKAIGLMDIAKESNNKDIQNKALNALFWLDLSDDTITIVNAWDIFKKNIFDFVSDEYINKINEDKTQIDIVQKEIIKFRVNPDKKISSLLLSILPSDVQPVIAIETLASIFWLSNVKTAPEYSPIEWKNQDINNNTLKNANNKFNKNFRTIYDINKYLISKSFLGSTQGTPESIDKINEARDDIQPNVDESQYMPWNEWVLLYWNIQRDWKTTWVYRNWELSYDNWKPEDLPDVSKKLLVFEWSWKWNINSQYPLYIVRKKWKKNIFQIYVDPNIDWLESVKWNTNMNTLNNEYNFWKIKSDSTPKIYTYYTEKFIEVVSNPDSSQLDTQIAFADLDLLNRYRLEPVQFTDEWWVNLPEWAEPLAYKFVTDAVDSVLLNISSSENINKILAIEISSRVWPNADPDEVWNAIQDSIDSMQNTYKWLEEFKVLWDSMLLLVKRISLWSIYNEVALDDLKSQFKDIPSSAYDSIIEWLIDSSTDLVEELIVQEVKKIVKVNKKAEDKQTAKEKAFMVEADKKLNPANNMANTRWRRTMWDVINAVPLLKNARAFMDVKIEQGRINLNLFWTDVYLSVPDLISSIYDRYSSSEDKITYITELNNEISRIWQWWWALNTQISQDALSLVKFFEYIATPNDITMSPEYMAWLDWVKNNVLKNWFDDDMMSWLRNVVWWSSMFLKYMWVMNKPFYNVIQKNFNYIFNNTWKNKLNEKNIARIFSEMWRTVNTAIYQNRRQKLTRSTRETVKDIINPIRNITNSQTQSRVWLWLMTLSYGTNLAVWLASTLWQWFSTMLMSNVLAKDRVFSNSKLNQVIKDAWLWEMVSFERFFTENALISLSTGLQNYLVDTNMQDSFIRSAMNNLLVRKWYVSDSDIERRLYSEWVLSPKTIADLRIEIDNLYKQYFWLALDYQDNAFRTNMFFQVLTLNGKRWSWAWRNFLNTITYWRLNMREVDSLENWDSPAWVKARNALNYEANRIWTTVAYWLLFAMRFAKVKKSLDDEDDNSIWSYIWDILKFKDFTTRQSQYLNSSPLLRIQKNLILDSLWAVIPDDEYDWFRNAVIWWSSLDDYNGWYKVYFNAFNEYTNNLQKLLIIPSTLLQWIFAAANAGDKSLVMDKIAETLEYRRWALSNYLSDQINNKYWLHTPRNRNSWMNSLVGIQWSEIKDQSYTNKQYQQLVANQSLRWMRNYGAYRLPIINTIRSAIQWDKYVPNKQLLFQESMFEAAQLPWTQSAYRDWWFQWELNPTYDLTERDIEHFFNKITESWLYGKWEWKPFAEWWWERVTHNENKDILIAWNLERAFPDTESYNEFITNVGSIKWATDTKTNQAKSYADIFARLQAWIKDWRMPSGSQKILIWTMADYLYNEYAKKLSPKFYWASDPDFYKNKEMVNIAKNLVVNELGPYMHQADKQARTSMIHFYQRERLPEKYDPIFNEMTYVDEKTWETKDALFYDSSYKDPTMQSIMMHDVISTDLIAKWWPDAPLQMMNAFALTQNFYEYQDDPEVRKYAQDLADRTKLIQITDIKQKLNHSWMSEMESLYFIMPLLSSNPRTLNRALNDLEFQKTIPADKLALFSDIMLWTDLEYWQLPEALADLETKASKANQWAFAWSSWFYSSNPSWSYSWMSWSGNKFSKFVKDNFNKLKVSNAQKRREYDPRSKYTPFEREVMNRRIKYLSANTDDFTKPSTGKWKKSAPTISRGRSAGKRARIKGPSKVSRRNIAKV
jgi:hypothetical protein